MTACVLTKDLLNLIAIHCSYTHAELLHTKCHRHSFLGEWLCAALHKHTLITKQTTFRKFVDLSKFPLIQTYTHTHSFSYLFIYGFLLYLYIYTWDTLNLKPIDWKCSWGLLGQSHTHTQNTFLWRTLRIKNLSYFQLSHILHKIQPYSSLLCCIIYKEKLSTTLWRTREEVAKNSFKHFHSFFFFFTRVCQIIRELYSLTLSQWHSTDPHRERLLEA